MPPPRRGSRSRRARSRQLGGPPPLVALRAQELGQDRGLALAVGHDDDPARDVEDARVERHPGDVRLDVRRRRHADDGLVLVERRPSPGRPTGRGRPHRSRAGRRRRPASRPSRAAPPRAASPRTAPRPSSARRPRRSPGRSGSGGRSRPGSARRRPPTGRRPERRPGLPARPDLEQAAVDDLGVRQRVVGRDEPVVAPPRLHDSHGTRSRSGRSARLR